MTIPDFDKSLCSPDIRGLPDGEVFQRLAFDLLRTQPGFEGLRQYQTGGVDGGIDLEAVVPEGRVVVECKKIGTDGLERARRVWKATWKTIERNLVPPSDGPAKQYGPWYDAGAPIKGYVFCMSSRFKNLGERAALTKVIQGDLSTLADRPFLTHLSGLVVNVLDWSDLSATLSDRPHLAFRWFPLAFAWGLEPLSDGVLVGFQAYLSGRRMPYYSRESHLESHPAPESVRIADEGGMLEGLQDQSAGGLVLTGGGGMGKTRLMYELGRRASGEGWLVGRIGKSFGEESLNALAKTLGPDTPALLLFDGVEQSGWFDLFAERVRLYNEDLGLSIRYVATCRTSSYEEVQDVEGHVRVDVSPGGAAKAWYLSYHEEVVRHVLEHSGVTVTATLLEACRRLPFLAVLAAYISYGTGSEAPDQSEVLSAFAAPSDEEKDLDPFVKWMRRRKRSTFPDSIRSELGGAEFDERLASLVASLPLEDEAIPGLPGVEYRMYEFLLGDGWIERREHAAGTTVAAAHDVLADGIILSYLQGSPAPRPLRFVRRLLGKTAGWGELRSIVATLHRLAPYPAVRNLDWPSLLETGATRETASWREIRGELARSPLLDASSRLQFFRALPELWDGAEEEASFQGAVGSIAWSLARGAVDLDRSDREALLGFVLRCVPHVGASSFVLSRGLSAFPSEVAPHALEWLEEQALTPRARFLLFAWLGSDGLELGRVLEWSSAWLAKFGDRYMAASLLSRVLALNPDGTYSVALRWLENHDSTPIASRVTVAWLRAGLKPSWIRRHVRRWIRKNSTSDEASFVYMAWLDSGGRASVVTKGVLAWLELHGGELRTHYLLQALARADEDVARGPVVSWLRTHAEVEDASYLLATWLRATGDAETVDAFVGRHIDRNAESFNTLYVIYNWLKMKGAPAVIADGMRRWLSDRSNTAEAQLLLSEWLQARGELQAFEVEILAWLNENGEEFEAHLLLQNYLRRGGDPVDIEDAVSKWLVLYGRRHVAQHLIERWAKSKGKPSVIRNHLHDWLDLHGSKEDAHFMIKCWLLGPQDPSEIQQVFTDWIDRYNHNSRVPNILGCWVGAGGDMNVVRDPVAASMATFRESQNTPSLIKEWLDRGGDADVVAEAAAYWMEVTETERPRSPAVAAAWKRAKGGDAGVETESPS